MFVLLKVSLAESLDSTPLRDELRSGQPRGERKLALWEELKVLAVARNVAYVVGGVYLGKRDCRDLNVDRRRFYSDRTENSKLCFRMEPEASFNIQLRSVPASQFFKIFP